MAEDSELEQRAVEELLRETNRARLRAETMGPVGWLKCPLRSTNKRFLLNTLRSAGMQRTNTEPRPGHSATRGRLRSDAPSRSRSRSPPRERRSTVGHRDHKNQQHRESWNYQDTKEDRDKQRGHRHRDRDNRDRRHGEDGQNKRHSS